MAITDHLNLESMRKKTHNLERWYFVIPAVIVLLAPCLVLLAVMALFSIMIMLAEPFKMIARRHQKNLHSSWYYVFNTPDDDPAEIPAAFLNHASDHRENSCHMAAR